MTIELLKAMRKDGTFHHATYRCVGSLWEGLWIYRKDAEGFRGFNVAGSFLKGSPDLDTAYKIVAGTGVSLGSFGQG